MGGYVPNPVALSVAKVAGYWALGALARKRALHPRSAFWFAVVRGAAGILVGVGFVAAMLALHVEMADRWAYALFQVLRVALWATLLHFWFRPRGGFPALALWTAAGTAVSIGIDLLFEALAQKNFPGATMTIC